MRSVVAAVALVLLAGSGPALAQSEIDHRVQRAWDDVFNPPPPGDPRTNWERRRDTARYRETRAAEHARWCHAHPSSGSCDRYYGRY